MRFNKERFAQKATDLGYSEDEIQGMLEVAELMFMEEE